MKVASQNLILQWFKTLRGQSRRELSDLIFKIVLGLAMVAIVSPFFMILFQLLSIGFIQLFGSGPGQGIEFLWTFPGAGLEGGIRNALVGTVELIAIASAVGIPLSVLSAVYITEYSPPGIARSIVEFASDVMAGIPSIVYGAFGFAFIVDFLHLGMGILAGSLTLAFMMIPTVLRTTQEALKTVPMSLREASLALGATKWSTTWNVTLRAAFPGIITGVLLAVGRVMGETAPLIFTAGNTLGVPTELQGSGSWVASLPYTIWAYISDPREYLQVKAYGAALTLMAMVLIVDVIANVISRKVTRRIV
ncbi:MAG: phosphate ABC transporter permease PstA [Candidatus Thorarchaeota archaeon]|nr:phosphate ABC transporter permease PstA [Candidatus Thorarchaeota archaeon]